MKTVVKIEYFAKSGKFIKEVEHPLFHGEEEDVLDLFDMAKYRLEVSPPGHSLLRDGEFARLTIRDRKFMVRNEKAS